VYEVITWISLKQGHYVRMCLKVTHKKSCVT